MKILEDIAERVGGAASDEGIMNVVLFHRRELREDWRLSEGREPELMLSG